MSRLLVALALLAALAGPVLAQQPKVLRYAFRVAETTFDPTQISDTYSRTVTPHIFEAPYTYDHLARPARIRPLTAVALPEVSDDYKVWTVKIRPGIYFTDDAAFKGQRRELVAQDYVYALLRFADPASKSPMWGYVDTMGIEGLAAARQRALDAQQPFDYDSPVAGVRALDRYTLQYRLAQPRPRFVSFLAASDLFGAVAREVVEHYGAQIGAHPVGTGPFVLAQWRRASQIVLEKSPAYRERVYDAEPAADDAEGQAILARLKGRRIPMIDRVEIAIIEETQPRWLSFLNGQADLIEEVPDDFMAQAMPGGQVAPYLAGQGITAQRRIRPDITMHLFNMEDPVLGGYTPDRVALRRAISLGTDVAREIDVVRRGQAIAAQSLVMPHVYGYDPAFKSEMSAYSPARAKALLDLYGYTDRDGDGWRDLPDGQSLVLVVNSSPDQASRQTAELWRRNMTVLGIRVRFDIKKWPEQLRAARAGQYMIWGVASAATEPDGQTVLQRYDGAQSGGQNLSRFNLPEMNRIYQQMSALPDGPERLALFEQAKRLAVAYMPMRAMVHRYATAMLWPQVVGYRKPLFWQEWWHMVDVAPAKP
ncbi:MAG: ABC transporter substrate-binding protein [Proteobacteria bacterium]|nr:ABC transporter substrate-binding protein [Pseudomonadota bacterium]